LCQILISIVLIGTAHLVGWIKIPTAGGQRAMFWKVFPLPMLYVLNLCSGLVVSIT
jgi:hypothetical protein